MTASGPNFIFLCYFADFDKNGTNNWKNNLNFEKVITSTRATHNQSFNVLGCFVLELLGFMFFMYILYFYDLLRNLTKTEQTIETIPNLQKMLWNTWISLNQSLNAVACFVLELLDFIFYVYTIFL